MMRIGVVPYLMPAFVFRFNKVAVPCRVLAYHKECRFYAVFRENIKYLGRVNGVRSVIKGQRDVLLTALAGVYHIGSRGGICSAGTHCND